MEFEVVIVGGGIVGLASALGLSQQNIKVAIIEPKVISDHINDSVLHARVSAINVRSVEMLKSLGVWQSITDAQIAAFTNMEIWDQNSNTKLGFSAREFSLTNLGFIVENQIIITALKQKLDQSEVVFFNPDNISTIQQNSREFSIQLASGKKLSSQLLIGADGSNSFVRDFFQFEYDKKPYGQQAIIATIETDCPHQNTAYQKFLTTGVIALLPLYHSHYCSIVWSEASHKAKHIIAMDDAQFQQKLNQTFGERLGALKVLSKRTLFPLIERHVYQYCRRGIVLIGDAAHTMHPLAGQGLNLGLADVQTFVETVVAANKIGRDYGDITTLSKFEQARRIENTIMIKTMGGLKKLFCNNAVLPKNLRYFGCNIINQSKLLKRFFIYQAMGKQ